MHQRWLACLLLKYSELTICVDITNFSFQSEFLGSSGVINIDSKGERSEMSLDILQLNQNTISRNNPLQLAALW